MAAVQPVRLKLVGLEIFYPLQIHDTAVVAVSWKQEKAETMVTQPAGMAAAAPAKSKLCGLEPSRIQVFAPILEAMVSLTLQKPAMTVT